MRSTTERLMHHRAVADDEEVSQNLLTHFQDRT
jgi:hypothetical protein